MKRGEISKIISIYLVFVPVLAFCVYILIGCADLNTCTGMLGPIFVFFKFILLIIIISILLIYEIIKVSKSSMYSLHRFLSIIVCGVLAYFTMAYSFEMKSWRLNDSILNSSLKNETGNIGQLKLLDTQTYYALYGHVDWSCSFAGSYKIKQDTLFLDGDPLSVSDGIIGNKYLITNDYLIPVQGNKEYKFGIADTLRIE